MQGLAQRTQLKLLEDFELGGRVVWVLEARPDPDAKSEYSRVLTYVDQEYCLPLRMEFVDRKQRLRKVLTARGDSLLQEAGSWVATELIMEDLRDQTHTDVVVEDLEVDGEISDRELMPSRLDRQR